MDGENSGLVGEAKRFGELGVARKENAVVVIVDVAQHAVDAELSERARERAKFGGTREPAHLVAAVDLDLEGLQWLLLFLFLLNATRIGK